MPSDDFIKTPFQSCYIKSAFEAYNLPNVISRATRNELVEKPEPLLCKRERNVRIPHEFWN